MDKISLARELGALAQSGLHFTKDVYDRERYIRLREIATELLAEASTLSVDEIADWRKEEFGYATPKVDVRALILSGDQVFLVSEDADGGRWTLPGGWADVNESPSEAVEREVLEESGYIVKARRLLAVFDREKQGHPPPFPYHAYKLYFLCEIVGGEAKSTLESSESGYFQVSDLPELSESRVLPGQIRRLYELVESGEPVTLFD